MKLLALEIIFLFVMPCCVYSQSPAPTKVDSMLIQLRGHSREDASKVNLLNALSREYYTDHKKDSAIAYAQTAQRLAARLNFKKGHATALRYVGNYFNDHHDSIKAVAYYQQALTISRQINDNAGAIYNLRNLGGLYATFLNFTLSTKYFNQALLIAKKTNDFNTCSGIYVDLGYVSVQMANYSKAFDDFQNALSFAEKSGEKQNSARAFESIGLLYRNLGNPDHAIINIRKALAINRQIGNKEMIGRNLGALANLYMNTQRVDTSIQYYNEAIKLSKESGDEISVGSHYANIAMNYIFLSDFSKAVECLRNSFVIFKKYNEKYGLTMYYLGMGQVLSAAPDSVLSAMGVKPAQRYHTVLENGTKALSLANEVGDNDLKLQALTLRIMSNEKLGNFKPAYFDLKDFSALTDSVAGSDKQKEIARKETRYEYEKKAAVVKAAQDKKTFQLHAILFSLGAGLLFVAIFLIIVWRQRNQTRRERERAELRTHELNQSNEQLEQSLKELKAAQKQLVQSEKMASLGELTAGIAHEIQNPLNFVNNFSDVNQELLVEMKDEMKKGNLEDANAIANDVIENEGKINHHGKRADAIVKGMLQHSRKSTGQKEPTDINALADEYLRLSYHGLRAKDKTFNATMKTDFDETIGKVDVIPQDIGRVILNLFNNAFYAAPLPSKGRFKEPLHKHEPTVWISTKRIDGHVEIKVRDNGPGIPQNIINKIFQPFFTTKPTGEGTGLGLSLSYDIIKAHGGTLKVETKEGEFTEFVISLPVNGQNTR